MQAISQFSSQAILRLEPATPAALPQHRPSFARRSGNWLYLAAKLSASAGTLAYMAGLDHGAIAACAILGAGAGAGLCALDRHLVPGHQHRNGFQATLHHAVYNDVHTLAGGLFGNLPFAAVLQGSFSRLAQSDTGALADMAIGTTLPPYPNATMATPVGDHETANVAGLDLPAFGALGAVASIPLALMFSMALLRAMRAPRADVASALAEAGMSLVAATHSQAQSSLRIVAGASQCALQGDSSARPAGLPYTGLPATLHAHLGRRSLLRIAALSLAGVAMLVAPACALRAAGAQEQALRLLILAGGNCAGNWVREILNQTTAIGWTAVKRDGEGWRHGLTGMAADRRLPTTTASTAVSSILFAASVGLMHALEQACGTAVVPAGQAILAQPPSRFCVRLALRLTLLVSTNEMAEALTRCAGFGVVAALTGTALEYKQTTGAGLFDTPALFARHMRKGGCHERAAAFAAARAIDGSTILLLNQIADLTAAQPHSQSPYWNAARVAAVLCQACTLGRTPLVVAWIIPKRPCADARQRRPSVPRMARRKSQAAARPAPAASRKMSTDGEFESISLDSHDDGSRGHGSDSDSDSAGDSESLIHGSDGPDSRESLDSNDGHHGRHGHRCRHGDTVARYRGAASSDYCRDGGNDSSSSGSSRGSGSGSSSIGSGSDSDSDSSSNGSGSDSDSSDIYIGMEREAQTYL